METLGISLGYLFVQVINLVLILSWIGLAVFALSQLRRRTFSDIAQAIWVALILLVPLGGAIAFLIVQPGDRTSS